MMKYLICFAFAVFVHFLHPAVASSPAQNKPLPVNAMPVLGRASPPPGFVQFCASLPAECLPYPAGTDTAARIALTLQRAAELDQVNRLVNTEIKPVSDMELYGERDFWTYPLRQGDCEDYVLLKRKILIARGWPAPALLITVVRDENDEGHAVLTVMTDRGEFILDNKRDKILAWNETGYLFVKRQSQADPAFWVVLTPQPMRQENLVGVAPAAPTQPRR